MGRNIKRIAGGIGNELVGRVPETGGSAFGVARLARAVESLLARYEPGQGKRVGRPSDPNWAHHPKVPMSEETGRRLRLLAERACVGGGKVSPM
jgi:hypothetical protein